MAHADLGAIVIVPIDEATGEFALVLDRTKPEPHYWKFPGGKVEHGDIDPKAPYNDELTADNAAYRETEEETGLDKSLTIVHRLEPVHKRTHTLWVRIALADFSELRATGDEGEIVKAFSLGEIKEMPNFMPSHRPFLQATLDFLGVAA